MIRCVLRFERVTATSKMNYVSMESAAVRAGKNDVVLGKRNWGGGRGANRVYAEACADGV
jgi:hypothetical protein